MNLAVPGRGAEPNPPAWPSSVRVFDPTEPDIGQTISNMTFLLNDRKTGHFSEQRVALLFKPGRYNVSFEVGYYVQVLGLGKSAADVVFTGARGPYCPAMDKRPNGAGSLDVFWRSAENFKSDAPHMLWAVSQ